MTKQEQITVGEVNQKVDDLIGRFDRQIRLTQWGITTVITVGILIVGILALIHR